jgi:hypothetical protein
VYASELQSRATSTVSNAIEPKIIFVYELLFCGWRPFLVSSNRTVVPEKDAQAAAFAAYAGTAKIRCAVQFDDVPLAFDLVHMQHQVNHFKLLVKNDVGLTSLIPLILREP